MTREAQVDFDVAPPDMVAELLGIPYDDYMQVALIPIAYTKGTDFKPAYRPPVETVMHIDQW